MEKLKLYRTCFIISLLFLITNSVFAQLNSKSKVENVISFGAKGDGKTDDTNAFRDALNSLLSSKIKNTLEVPKGVYLLKPINIDISDIIIIGEGTIISYNTKGATLLEINGNNIILQNLTFKEGSFSRELVNLNGNNNQVINVTFEGKEKSKSDKVIYSDRLLHLSNQLGKGNVIDNCKFINGRVGVCVNGSFKLKNSEVNHNIIGVLVRPSSRNSEIAYNTISYNDVNGKSGNDGILAQRNVDNIHIHSNTINHSGEHGIYFQGSNSIIEKNKVFNNNKSGIKLASYNDQLFNHTSKDYYIGQNNIIRDNLIYDNVEENRTNAGIYLQAPLQKIMVENNYCYNNYYGIRTTSVYSKRDDKKRTTLKDITIKNNKVINNRGTSLWIEGESNILIFGNEADNLTTATKSKNVKMELFVLEKNKIGKITLHNLNGGRIMNNEFKEIDNKSSNLNLFSKSLEKNNIKIKH